MSCSTTKSEDGVVRVIASVEGSWPETIVGIRIAVKTSDWNVDWVVSEAFLSASEEVLSAHSASHNTTVFETTFSLPEYYNYLIYLEALVRDELSFPGDYYEIGNRKTTGVVSGRSYLITLSGNFDVIVPR